MKSSLPTVFYRPDIDGLRAIAILSVIVFHFFPKALSGGFVGVDVFFVISGFLITRILAEDIRHDRFSLIRFYFHRVCRILPAFTLVLISGLIAGWYFLMPEEYASFGKHVLRSVFFVQNLNLRQEAGYFDLASDLKPLLHIWSLSLEEQFYIIWPLVFLIFGKNRKRLLGILALLSFFSFCLNLKYVSTDLTRAFYGLETRFWELALGGAFGLSVIPKLEGRFSQLLSSAGLLMLLSSFWFFGAGVVFPGWWALIPVFGTCILLRTENSFVNKILSRASFVWVGKISYPLYLWHWIIFSFIRINSPEVSMEFGRNLAIRFACIALSFVLAWGTYLWIEKPVRKLRDLHKKKIGFGLLAVLLLVGLAGWFVKFNKGFPKRVHAINVSSPPASPELFDCRDTVSIKGVEWCKTSKVGVADDVVVIGDSHGEVLSPGIASYYKKQNRSVMILGTGDTIGLYGVGHRDRGNKYEVGDYLSLTNGFDWIVAQRPKTVLLISRGPFYFEGIGYGIEERSFVLVDTLNHVKAPNDQIFLSGLERTLSLLTKAGIEVVFVFDNFELGFRPQEICIPRPLSMFEFKVLDPCAIRIEDMKRRYDRYQLAVSDVLRRYPLVKTFDPNKYLCDSRLCYGIKDGIILYVDHNHLSGDASLWLEKFFNF